MQPCGYLGSNSICKRVARWNINTVAQITLVSHLAFINISGNPACIRYKTALVVFKLYSLRMAHYETPQQKARLDAKGRGQRVSKHHKGSSSQTAQQIPWPEVKCSLSVFETILIICVVTTDLQSSYIPD